MGRICRFKPGMKSVEVMDDESGEPLEPVEEVLLHRTG